MPKVAVVLSGCGVFDGSEIHEAVSILVHLSRHGADVRCFAPDVERPAVNHLTKKPEPHPRNVLVEAARIARGKIAALSDLRAADFDAVVFPGGFGAATNLSDFAEKGADCTVLPEVDRVVKEFHAAGKPVGMCCIAPVIAARVLGTAKGGPGVRVTIGDDDATAGTIARMGATNVPKPVTEALTDAPNKLSTAPAYMYADAPIHAVYEGIGAMIDSVMDHLPATRGRAQYSGA
jgi:enhancing lycopene biosynthesis protein 2